MSIKLNLSNIIDITELEYKPYLLEHILIEPLAGELKKFHELKGESPQRLGSLIDQDVLLDDRSINPTFHNKICEVIYDWQGNNIFPCISGYLYNCRNIPNQISKIKLFSTDNSDSVRDWVTTYCRFIPNDIYENNEYFRYNNLIWSYDNTIDKVVIQIIPSTKDNPIPDLTPTPIPTNTTKNSKIRTDCEMCPTPTNSLTPSITPTISVTTTVSLTKTPSITPSITLTVTPDFTTTPTPTNTITSSVTPTVNLTQTPTPTKSGLPKTTPTPSSNDTTCNCKLILCGWGEPAIGDCTTNHYCTPIELMEGIKEIYGDMTNAFLACDGSAYYIDYANGSGSPCIQRIDNNNNWVKMAYYEWGFVLLNSFGELYNFDPWNNKSFYIDTSYIPKIIGLAGDEASLAIVLCEDGSLYRYVWSTTKFIKVVLPTTLNYINNGFSPCGIDNQSRAWISKGNFNDELSWVLISGDLNKDIIDIHGGEGDYLGLTKQGTLLYTYSGGTTWNQINSSHKWIKISCGEDSISRPCPPWCSPATAFPRCGEPPIQMGNWWAINDKNELYNIGLDNIIYSNGYNTDIVVKVDNGTNWINVHGSHRAHAIKRVCDIVPVTPTPTKSPTRTRTTPTPTPTNKHKPTATPTKTRFITPTPTPTKTPIYTLTPSPTPSAKCIASPTIYTNINESSDAVMSLSGTYYLFSDGTFSKNINAGVGFSSSSINGLSVSLTVLANSSFDDFGSVADLTFKNNVPCTSVTRVNAPTSTNLSFSPKGDGTFVIPIAYTATSETQCGTPTNINAQLMFTFICNESTPTPTPTISSTAGPNPTPDCAYYQYKLYGGLSNGISYTTDSLTAYFQSIIGDCTFNAYQEDFIYLKDDIVDIAADWPVIFLGKDGMAYYVDYGDGCIYPISNDTNWTQIATSEYIAYLLNDNNEIYAFEPKTNSTWQRGPKAGGVLIKLDIPTNTLPPIKSIVCDEYGLAALCTDNRIYTIIGRATNRFTIKINIKLFSNVLFKQVKSGVVVHGIGVDNRAYVANVSLNNIVSANHERMSQISSINNVTDISVNEGIRSMGEEGYINILVLDNNGKIYEASHKIVASMYLYSFNFTEIQPINNFWKYINAGEQYNLAISDTGELYKWQPISINPNTIPIKAANGNNWYKICSGHAAHGIQRFCVNNPTPTPIQQKTPTPTRTPTKSITPTRTPTISITPTRTPTKRIPTPSPSFGTSITPTRTPTKSITPTRTPTKRIPTPSPSFGTSIVNINSIELSDSSVIDVKHLDRVPYLISVVPGYPEVDSFGSLIDQDITADNSAAPIYTNINCEIIYTYEDGSPLPCIDGYLYNPRSAPEGINKIRLFIANNSDEIRTWIKNSFKFIDEFIYESYEQWFRYNNLRWEYDPITNTVVMNLEPSTKGNPGTEPTPTPTKKYSKIRTDCDICPTPTNSITPTISITPSVTNSITPTKTQTVTRTVTPTSTIDLTSTPTRSLTPTISITVSVTPTKNAPITPTPSITVTRTNTLTPSLTSSITPTISITKSSTPTPTITKSITPTISITPTNTPTRTVTKSITPTISMTKSAVTPTPSKTIPAPIVCDCEYELYGWGMHPLGDGSGPSEGQIYHPSEFAGPINPVLIASNIVDICGDDTNAFMACDRKTMFYIPLPRKGPFQSEPYYVWDFSQKIDRMPLENIINTNWIQITHDEFVIYLLNDTGEIYRFLPEYNSQIQSQPSLPQKMEFTPNLPAKIIKIAGDEMGLRLILCENKEIYTIPSIDNAWRVLPNNYKFPIKQITVPQLKDIYSGCYGIGIDINDQAWYCSYFGDRWEKWGGDLNKNILYVHGGEGEAVFINNAQQLLYAPAKTINNQPPIIKLLDGGKWIDASCGEFTVSRIGSNGIETIYDIVWAINEGGGLYNFNTRPLSYPVSYYPAKSKRIDSSTNWYKVHASERVHAIKRICKNPTPTPTPTPTRTPTPTCTPTKSITPTCTPTISITPTRTPTKRIPTPSPSFGTSISSNCVRVDFLQIVPRDPGAGCQPYEYGAQTINVPAGINLPVTVVLTGYANDLLLIDHSIVNAGQSQDSYSNCYINASNFTFTLNKSSFIISAATTLTNRVEYHYDICFLPK